MCHCIGLSFGRPNHFLPLAHHLSNPGAHAALGGTGLLFARILISSYWKVLRIATHNKCCQLSAVRQGLI